MASIEDWLNGLGLGKYSKVFAENDVDLRALPHLNGADLHELGVSLGHRKVMLAAIADLRHTEIAETEAETKPERLGPIGDREPDLDGAEPLGAPGPDLRLLSVLFCDMLESTGLSARFSAEEMHDLIRRLPGHCRKRGHAVRRLRREVSWRWCARLFRMADGI